MILNCKSLRVAAIAAVFVGLLASLPISSVRAAPVELGFDYTTNNQNVIGSVAGTSGDLLFTLTVDTVAPDAFSSFVNGDFLMRLLGPSDVLVGGVQMSGFVFQDFQDLGDAASQPGIIPNPAIDPVSFGLVTTWTLHVDALQLPLLIAVAARLDNFPADLAFNPRLTVDVVSGDLSVTPTVTPIPGSLALFASGLGALGLIGMRRRRKVQVAA